ncbi:hypothetical protein PIB30_031953 [Stylosanthes scabra]|uniref:Uncharacterized protein n=1 Tax=Stylosanthes scabra TaxID=79078 RepID=A0ABU6RC96_9FABA|nr:hypothetical protein [Stylosanthes scabra]
MRVSQRTPPVLLISEVSATAPLLLFDLNFPQQVQSPTVAGSSSVGDLRGEASLSYDVRQILVGGKDAGLLIKDGRLEETQSDEEVMTLNLYPRR